MPSLAKNSLLYLIATIATKAISFLLLPFYSHLITPDQYGYVYVVTAFTTFLSLFLSLSLGGAIQRFYFDCENQTEIKTLYTNIVLIVLFFTTVIGSIFYFAGSSISSIINLPIEYYNYAVLISAISVFYPLILSLLYASQSAKKVSITSIFLGGCGVAIQLILVLLLEDKALALVKALLANSLLTFIIFLIYSKPYWATPSWNFANITKYLKYSLSQLPSDVSVWLINCSDRILINSMKGSSFAGLYGMGANLGNIPQILFHSVNKAYVPYVFEKYKEIEKGHNDSESILVQTTTTVFAVITASIAIIAALSNNIISLLASQYSESAGVMLLILIAVWIDCSRIMFMNPMAYNIRYIKIKSAIWVISSILSISLNFYTIPKYGMYGACCSLIASYGLSCAFILYFSNKAMKLNYQKNKIIKIIVCTFIFSASYLIGSDLKALVLKVPCIIIYLAIMTELTISLKKGFNYVKVLFNK